MKVPFGAPRSAGADVDPLGLVYTGQYPTRSPGCITSRPQLPPGRWPVPVDRSPRPALTEPYVASYAYVRLERVGASMSLPTTDLTPNVSDLETSRTYDPVGNRSTEETHLGTRSIGPVRT